MMILTSMKVFSIIFSILMMYVVGFMLLIWSDDED